MLAELRAPDLGIARQHAIEVAPDLAHGLRKHLGLHFERGAWHLDHGRKRHADALEKAGDAYHAFIANGRHFEHAAIREGAHDRDDRIQRKIDRRDGRVGGNERILEPQREGLQREEHLGHGRGGERPEQPVLVEKMLRGSGSHERLLSDREDGVDRARLILDRRMHRALRIARLGTVPEHTG
jgi:hypothetical protein